MTKEIAQLSNFSEAVVQEQEERNDPLYNRLFKSFLRGSYEGSINAPKLNLVDSESILRITNRVVERAAAIGSCVIVRRGWRQFLKNRPCTLRVLLYAPRNIRCRRLQSRGKTEKEAAKNWWIASSANALISSRTISKSNGRTRGLSHYDEYRERR